MNRRRLLRLLCMGSVSGLAGCGGVPDDGPSATVGPSTNAAGTSTRSSDPAPETPEETEPSSPEASDRALELPWAQLPGPAGGPVTDISLSKADPDWMYSTTATAGIFVSSNGARTWRQGRSEMHHRNRVWASPHDPTVAYTQERTDDGGDTWWGNRSPDRHRHPLNQNTGVEDMVWDPTEEDVIYAATIEGFHRTFDDGEHWERVGTGLQEGDEHFWRIAVHPERSGTVFLDLSGAGIARSTDHGETWSLVEGSDDIPGTGDFYGLVLTDPDTEELYLAKNGSGVFRLQDGKSTKITADYPQLEFPWWAQMALSADREDLYFVAGRREVGWWDDLTLYRCRTDSGELNPVETPTKPTAVTAHPEDPAAVYHGGVSWLYESRDRGVSWSKRSDGFYDNYLITVGVNKTIPQTMFPGSICSTGLSVSWDGGRTFEWKRSGLQPWHGGKFGEHYLMQISAIDEFAYATTAAGLLTSTDNGESWRLLDNEFSGQGGDAPYAHLHGLAVHPEDPQVVYVGTGRGGPGDTENDIFDGVSLWKSVDAGQSWREITTGLPTDANTTINDIIVNPHRPDEVYAATIQVGMLRDNEDSGVGVGLFQSTDGGQSWTQLDTPFSNIHAVTVDAADPEVVFASVPRWDTPQHQGVFRSTDGGEHWQRVLDYRTRALLAHPDEHNLLFAGSQKHPSYWDVLVSGDGGETWAEGDFTVQVGLDVNQREYDAVDPHTQAVKRGQILEFALDTATSKLYAATNGAGLWNADVSSLES